MSENVAISVENVKKSFKLPHEKNTSLKSAIINFYRHKKTFESQQVLKGVSFEVNKGDFFGVVGRNGGGKSTLLKLLAGIYTPDAGRVIINGTLTPFIELGVGFNPELTGRENIFLNGALLGFSRKEMERMYDGIVTFSELSKFMDQKLKNYSSGMQVRLAFAIAIRAQSDILLLDEVLAVGDSRFQKKCFEYFYKLKKEGKTVIFISHDQEAVRRFCDKAILIENGEIKLAGTPQEVIDAYALNNFETEPSESPDDTTKVREIKVERVAKVSITLTSKKILKSTDKLKLTFNYQLIQSRQVELRVALVKDGIAFAHINTRGMALPDIPGKYQKDLTLSLDSLMDGEHEIYCGVFDAATEEQLAFKARAASFLITDADPRLYGFLRLEGDWSDT